MKKKFIWRSIALTLVFALLIQVMPVSALSINNTINQSSGNEAESTIIEENVNVFSCTDVLEANDENIICEVPELREEAVKHFRLNDGSMVAAVYDMPVHEEASDGTWVDIDNTIVPGEDDEGNSSLNKGNTISFANKAKEGKLLTIKTDHGKIRWSLNGISEKVEAASYIELEVEANNTKMATKSVSGIIRYEDVMANVDLEYQMLANDIKENIILNSSSAAQNFSFTLDIGNKMTAVLEDNCVYIYSNTGEVVRIIEAPYMLDANGESSGNIVLGLTKNSKAYTVTLSPDMEWLRDTNRVYPVTIDPTITDQKVGAEIENTSVYSKEPTSTSKYRHGSTYVGRVQAYYNNIRGAIKFTLPTAIKESDVVISAKLKLSQYNYSGYEGSSFYVKAHQITSDLPMSTLTWNKLNGNYDPTVLDYQYVSASTNKKSLYWDITTAVKSWYLEGNNYGLTLISGSENGNNICVTFNTNYSGSTTSYQPAVIISYLNHDGMEDYLTYHYAGSETMGSIAVGDFTGNLIYAYTDLAMTGNYMPVTIQHVYNHSQRDNETLPGASMHYGAGMRLNISQRIQSSSISGYPYKYTDADGTVHYFKLKSGTSGDAGSTYTKEFDTTTILKKNSDGTYTLSDNSSITYKFNSSGLMTTVTDTSNSKSMTINYANGLVSNVVDGSGRSINFTFDSNNYLTSITDPSNRTTSYTYTNNCLTRITKPDGTEVNLNYTCSDSDSTYILSEVEDIDGSKVAIGYYPYSPHRVASITEYGTEGTEGNKLTWTYTPGETTVTDRDGKSESMMFDSYGHTVCIRDGEGNAVYGKYGNTSDNQKHSLNYQSQMQHTVTNYLKNHGFEDGSSNWTVYGEASGTTSIGTGGYIDNMFANTSMEHGSERGVYQEVSVPNAAGNTFTFSAYLKVGGMNQNGNSDATGMYIGVKYQNAAEEWITEENGPFLNMDWQRHSITFTVPADAASNTIQVFTTARDFNGAYLTDCAQLEKGAVANRYNILENGHFRDAIGLNTAENWDFGYPNTATQSTVEGRDGTGFKLIGTPASNQNLRQDIAIAGSEGDTYVFAAWAKANAVRQTDLYTGGGRVFGLLIRFYKNSTTYEDKYFTFEAKTPGWQYLSCSWSAPFNYTSVRVYLLYNKQANHVIFDDAQLHKEPFGTDYTYDSYGRVSTVTDSMGRKTTYTYAANNRDEISKITYSDGTTATFTYDTTTWKLLSSVDANGKTTTYNYDENGNSTGAVMTADGLTLNSAITEYSGSYVLSTTDVLGNTVNYDYDPLKGTLNCVTDPSGVDTSYTYNAQNDYLTSVSSAGSEVDYTYSYGKLVSISHNTDSNSENDVTYNFVYDEFGNTSSVKVGSQALISHTYEPNNGLLTQSTYGNGDTYTPTYDSLDRITAVSYNGIEKYNWEYGADGRIGLHNDLVNDVTWRYEYSKDGSLTSAYGTNGERFDYTYEPSTGKLLTATVSDGTTSKTTTYNYSDHTNGEDANLIESVVLPTATVTYDYDGFYRASYDVEVNGSDILTTDYTFLYGIGENATTTLVESMTTSGSDWSETLSYTYDCKGNIETISENGAQKAKYYYDDLNQLVREDNAWTNKTVAYTYDNGGNIQLIENYTLTSASDLSALTPSTSSTYTYGDSNWKDKLTSYNGSVITYDEIGNPLSYYRGYTFDWQNGRQLASVSTSGLSINYKYNSDGIRTSKTVNGVTTTYTLEGSNIVKETNGTDTIWYYYDASGSLTGFEFNDTPYFYVKNVQGDITAITDANGNIVVEYVYDSWGALASITGTLASTVGVKNPFRYRLYYYDTEIGFYYLNSRYYDPATKRFINADGLASSGQGILGCNMFSNCNNNPIIMKDGTGAIPTYCTQMTDAGCVSERVRLAWAMMRASQIGERATIKNGYIGFDLEKEGDAIYDLVQSGYSLEFISDIASSSACNKYNRLIGREFLLSDSCVSYELKEHIYAYFWADNKFGIPNTIAIGFLIKKWDYNADSVYNATKSTDIRERDVVKTDSLSAQANIFKYKKGIRDIYVGTEFDPWADVR